ncbi:hypothetical protein T492DRAFT_848387 [Pavlovales sp. CCMP2436]|nr:hypothetical protein T492DRAFT_848387 [Pavlovales sp. CCMP2436]
MIQTFQNTSRSASYNTWRLTITKIGPGDTTACSIANLIYQLRVEDASPLFTSASTITPSTAWPASTAFLVTDSSRSTGYEGWNAFASTRTGWKSATATYGRLPISYSTTTADGIYRITVSLVYADGSPVLCLGTLGAASVDPGSGTALYPALIIEKQTLY